MRLNRLLLVIDFIFVFNLYYAIKLVEKRSEMALDEKLIRNKYIHFVKSPMQEIRENERLFF